MVSANKALTNAHVIYNKDHGGLATSIQVIPGKNEPYFINNPFQSANATNVYYPTQLQTVDTYTTDVIRYDWAVLKLNKDIGNQCRWLNLSSGGGTVGVEGPDYHSSGYPVHNVERSNYDEFQTDFLDSHDKEYQFHATGKILSTKLHYMEHAIDALPGQSGSPIYSIGNNGTVSVVAINTAEEHRYFILNYAKRITPEIINTVSSF